MAYCTLHSTLYTAHCNIPQDLAQAKTSPHSSSLFLPERNGKLSQKCTVCVYCAVRCVVYYTPYSVQYNVLYTLRFTVYEQLGFAILGTLLFFISSLDQSALHTLKNLYLKNFEGHQLKKSPRRITQNF